jgi:electron transport complex protein RnfC
MRLVPSAISVACEAEATELYEEVHVLDCIECGVCTYVCPARRPIVHQVKQAKAHLAAERRKAQQQKRA